MPSYRATPAAKKPANGAKPKMPMHKMPGTGHLMADKDMATAHMMPKPMPQKPRKAAKKGK